MERIEDEKYVESLEKRLKLKNELITELTIKLDRLNKQVNLLVKENRQLLGMLYEANEQYITLESKSLKERYYEAFREVL